MDLKQTMKTICLKGHKWLVLLTSGLVTFLDYGVMLSFGSMFVAILDTFGETRSTTAVIQSLMIAVGIGSSVFVGWFITRFGVTPVAFTGAVLVPVGFITGYFANSVMFLIPFAIISGLGIACMHMSGIVSIGEAFRGRQLTFAVSIQSLGTPLGGFMYPSLVRALVMEYGLRGTFLVLAGILMNNLAGAFIFAYATRQSTQDKTIIVQNQEMCVKDAYTEAQTDGRSLNHDTSIQNKSNTIKTNISRRDETSLETSTSVLNTKKLNNDPDCKKRSGLTSFLFIMLCTGTAIICANLVGHLTLYQDMMKYKGFSISDSNIFYMCYSAFNVGSRFLPIFPSLFPKINLFIIPMVAAICGCLGQLVFLWTSSYIWAMVGMALTGTCDGALIAATQGISFEILHPDKQAIGIGLISTMIGLLATGAGPAYGAIRDTTESYDVALMIASGFYCLCTIMFILCIVRSDRTTCFKCRTRAYVLKET